MSHIDVNTLTAQLLSAYATGEAMVDPPSLRYPGFDLTAAYAVEAQLTKVRREHGHATVGRKVGYASKALWRRLKLDTLVWARMYDDTVKYADDGAASLSLAGMCSPRIEPEIVFKLKETPAPALSEPHAGESKGPALSEPHGGESKGARDALVAVEWFALGFEIVDCVFRDWKFQPADFVASFGLHAALIVGEPVHVKPEMLAKLADELPALKARLLKDGQLIEEGSGKNSLGSPALALGELAAAIARQPGAEPLAGGELVSTGSLTAPHPVAAGDRWTFEAEGLSCCTNENSTAKITVTFEQN
jgi:2-keto-4-pentenoate hydratase